MLNAKSFYKKNNNKSSTAASAEEVKVFQACSYVIKDDLVLTYGLCKYSDKNWSFYDTKNPRIIIDKPAPYLMQWARYTEGTPESQEYILRKSWSSLKSYKGILPLTIIEDLRKFFLLEIKFGAVIASLETTKSRAHGGRARNGKCPRAAITTTKAIIKFIAFVRNSSKQKGISVEFLSDLDLQAIEKWAPLYPGEFSTFHKTFFNRMALAQVKKTLTNPVTYSHDDVAQVSWKRLIKLNKKQREKSGNVRRDIKKMQGEASKFSHLPFHPEMFSWMSNLFRALVADMMDTLSLTREDKELNPLLDELSSRKLKISDKYPTFNTCFRYLKRLYASNPPEQVGAKYYKKERKINYHFKKNRDRSQFNMVRTGDIREVVRHVRAAAQGLVFLYTGMRHSDARAIRVDSSRNSCLVDHLGFSLILGTHIKGTSKYAAVDHDRWVTIACVRDAIRLLEYLRFTNSNAYLFSSSNFIYDDDPRPADETTTCRMIGEVLATYDFDKTWISSIGFQKYKYIKDEVPLHPHRFRHSLAAELARVGCNLPYISMQLKHFYSVYSQYSRTSLSYGGQAEAVTHRIRGNIHPGLELEVKGKAPTAREEIFLAYFNPNGNFAGGSANVHKQHLREFFDGKAMDDSQIKKYIQKLSYSGVPLSVCGFGYCNKRIVYGHEAEVCDGDLCDPECDRHLILEKNAPMIEARLKRCISEIRSKDQPIYLAKWRKDKKRYARYLKDLGKDPAKIESEYITELKMKEH